MARLKIKDAPLLTTIVGDEKIPTGGKGDFSVTVDMLLSNFEGRLPFATKTELENVRQALDAKISNTKTTLELSISALDSRVTTSESNILGVQQDLTTHKADKANPHSVTKSQVGLGNVDNTSDAHKPISTATQAALNKKANTQQLTDGLALKFDKQEAQDKIYKNGAALPYDSSVTYNEGAVVVKDGGLQQKIGVDWEHISKENFVKSIDDLRRLKPRENGQVVYISQHTKDGRGSGYFMWNESSTIQDDNGVHIKVNNINTGRWIRQFNILKTDDFGLNLRNDDVTATLQLMDSLANVIFINDGVYTIDNLIASKRYEFSNDAWFRTNTKTNSNGVLAKSGLTMIRPKFKHNVLQTPMDGDYGSAIRIGTYRQPNDINVSVNNVNIFEPIIEHINSVNTGQSFEILGNAFDITITRPKMTGKGFGIIAHWGGDVGNDGHGSNITYSYHPHNITIINPKFSSSSIGMMQTSLILSACYDIYITDVDTEGVDTSIYIASGDVYDQVSVDRDKGKPCTNININGVDIKGYPINANPVFIKGITDTRRTTKAPTVQISKDQKASLNITGLRISVPRSTDTSNLILCRYARGVKLDAIITGVGVHQSFHTYLDTCIDSDFSIKGVAKSGVQTRSLRNCNVSVVSNKVIKTNVAGEFGLRGINLTYSGNMIGVAGESTMTYTPTETVVLFDGTSIISDGVMVAKVLTTTECKENVPTIVSVTPISSSFNSTSNTVKMCLMYNSTEYTGGISGYYRNMYFTDMNNVIMSNTSRESHTSDLVADGDFSTNVIFSNKFTTADTGLTNISTVTSLYFSPTKLAGILFSGCTFDFEKTNTKVSRFIEVQGSNHTGIVVQNCKIGVCTTGIATNIPNSVMPQCQQPSFVNNTNLSSNLGSVSGFVGGYAGNWYVGYSRSNDYPKSGFWRTGDRIYDVNLTVGKTQGWICTLGGNSPTWVAMPKL